MLDVDLWDILIEKLDEILSGLMDLVLSKEVIQKEWYALSFLALAQLTCVFIND